MSITSKRVREKLRTLDYKIFWLINGRAHNKYVDYLIKLVNGIDAYFGNLSKLIILLLVIGFILWHSERDSFKADFLFVAAVLAINAFFGYVFKRFLKAGRPLSVFGEKVHVFSERLYKYSMPSYHTQIAFCLAALLSCRFHAYAFLFYVGALLIGLYRVYVGSHFPSDVVMGAIMGFGITKIMLKLFVTC